MLSSWKRRGKAVIYKAQGELSPDTNTNGTLILDFQALDLWENTFLRFRPSCLWCFVRAAPTDCYRHIVEIAAVDSGVLLLLRSPDQEASEFSIQRTEGWQEFTFGSCPVGGAWALGGLALPHWWTEYFPRPGHLSTASVVSGKPWGLKGESTACVPRAVSMTWQEAAWNWAEIRGEVESMWVGGTRAVCSWIPGNALSWGSGGSGLGERECTCRRAELIGGMAKVRVQWPELQRVCELMATWALKWWINGM